MSNIKNLLPAKLLLIVSVLCTIFIIWASLGRKTPTIDINQGDKLGHALAYCTLTTVWGLYMISKSLKKDKLMLTLSIVALLCCAFGILMEGLQYGLTTYRVFDLYDVLANTTGVSIGVLFLMVIKRFYTFE